MICHLPIVCTIAALMAAGDVRGVEPGAADRGREALLSRGHLRPEWGTATYRDVARDWDIEAPNPSGNSDAFADAFRDRYGLHPAPYPNDGLPMGLRRATDPASGREGIQVDCMICHGGSIGGTSYVGLGNSQLDLIGLYRDLFAADGRPLFFTGFTVNTARGTVNAGQMAVILLSLRNPDLSRRILPKPLRSQFPETDVPAWWTLKHKRTMYADGRTDARSVRSIMQFLLGEKSAEELRALEPDFADIRAYLDTIEAPAYPFPIDQDLADAGRTVFNEACARCHGTYGESPSYPNRIVPLEVIGTDPTRALAGSDSLISHYNSTWFGEQYPVVDDLVGYQAPPLDGVWATAPYLHNGSVPTLRHLLDSPTRPARFRRPPSTDFEHYDPDAVGWKSEVLDPVPPDVADRDRDRTIFDIHRRGLDNAGHTFGDGLSDAERMAIIEYLKTL